MKKIYSLPLAAFLFMLVFNCVSIYAQPKAPDAPVKFTANVEHTDISFIKLSWVSENMNDPRPQIYNIYMADKRTENLSDFQKIDYVKPTPDMFYQYNVTNIKSGTYSFYVTAGIFDGNTIIESKPTNIVAVDFENEAKPVIKITSPDGMYAVTGIENKIQITAESNVKCPIKFDLVGEVPKGMMMNPETGTILWTPDLPAFTVVSIGVKAYLECDNNVTATRRINIKVIESDPNNDKGVKIVSEPVTQAKTGETYMYQLKATSGINCPLNFKFIGDVPEGMNIDKESGMITWIPAKDGIYYIAVMAYATCDEKVNACQKFAIKVGDIQTDDKPCVALYGKVKFDDGGGDVMEGLVSAWRTDIPPEMSSRKPVYQSPVQGGMFKMMVPEGSYKIEVEGRGVAHEWFEDAADINNAKVLELKCNQTLELNINVAKLPEPRHFNVSGKVTSEKDGSPVMAVVQFMPAQWLNRKDNNNDKNNKPDPAEFTTKTDENGNYSIDLPEVFTYVAHAMPVDPKTYSDQFYDKVASPTEADLINLESDVKDINFALKERGEFKNEFRGVVENAEGLGLKSRVIASLVSGNNNNKGKFSYFAESDENGKFTFKNLVPGEYVLLSIPMDNNYVPGYYKIGEIAVLKWKEATRVAIAENTIDVVCEIKHRQREGQKGIIQVSGMVSEMFGLSKNGDIPQGGSQPIAGAFIYAVDANNNIINYSFSDDGGVFTLEELSQGAAKIIADKPGYGTYEMNLDLDMKNASMGNLNMNMSQETESGVDENILAGNIAVRVYPSPLGSSATVEFNAEAGKALISITNIMGIEVMRCEIEATNGLNTYNLDASALPSGAYFINIRNGGNTRTVAVRVVK